MAIESHFSNAGFCSDLIHTYCPEASFRYKTEGSFEHCIMRCLTPWSPDLTQSCDSLKRCNRYDTEGIIYSNRSDTFGIVRGIKWEK